MPVLQKRRKNVCMAILLLTMIIAIEYYVGEMGFDDMLNSGYMIVNSYAAESDLLITPAGHIDSKSSTLPKGAYRVAIFNATVSNNEGTYAIILIRNDNQNSLNGFQIINVTDPLYPKVVSSVMHPPSDAINPKYIRTSYPNSVETFTLDGKVYAVVTNDPSGGSAAGIQIIDVTNPTIPGDNGTVASVGGTNRSYLNGPQGLDIFNIGNYPYAIIANYYHTADKEREVTMINMTEPSSLYHIDDKSKLVLARANDVDTFKIGTDTYAIVASRGDNGIQIIDVTNPAAYVVKGNLTDTSQPKLKYASGVDTIKIGTDTYAIVTSGGYDTINTITIPSNIQIINMTNPDNPEAKGALNENSVSVLNDPYGVETFTLDGSAYAIVASRGNSTTPGGIQIIDMSDPDNPAAKGNATYDKSKYPILDKANGVAIFNATVGGNKETYAIVTSEGNKVSGVQIVRITNSDDTSPTLTSSPTLDLNSHTLSFNFDETIDVSKIVWSDITINNANGASITSLVHFNLPSVDSSTFKIEFTGPVYRSMLAAIANEGPPQITVGDSAIQDFAGKYFDELVNGNLTVVGSTDRTGLLIIPAASITDNSTLALKNAYGVDIFTIDDNPYAVVASRDDNAIQIINMTDPYYPKASANVTYTAGNPTALKKSHGVATFDMGTGKYAIVTSLGNGTDKERGSIQIIDVTTPDAPVVKGRLVDNSTSDINFLGGASGVDTFKIGADTYATVASRDDNAIQIIKMTDPDMPSYAGRETSGGGNTLDGANDVDTFTLDGSVYAIVASQRDDGFQIVDVSTPSNNPLSTGSGVDNYVENDSPYTGLRGASGVDTFKIDTDTYAIVASQRDDGFQIINVTTPGSPSAAGSGTDNDTLNPESMYYELDGAYGVDIFNMTDNNSMTSTYAIVASQEDNGIQIINMTTPLTPSPAGSLSDNSALVLKKPHGIATFKIGDCNTYAIATSRGDNGIQVMELIRELTPPVITLLGDNPQTIYLGGAYDELRATADDGSEVIPDSSEVNTNVTGTYPVTYDSIDPSCNVATQVTRTVEVAVSPITLTPAGSITDGSDGYDVLEGASDVDIFNMTDSNNITSTYAIVASSDDNSFQIINVTDPYHPLPAGSGTDGSGGYTELLGANDVDTFEIGTDRYAIIASKDDDGFQIVDVSNPSSPSAAGSGTDNDGTNDSSYTVLDGASGVKTFEIGTDRYAIIASVRDSGIQIINMTTPSSPSVANFGSIESKGASGVDIFTIDDNPYAVVASKGDSILPGGFQIMNVINPYRPSFAGSGTDGIGGYDVLDGASGVKTFEIGTDRYAIIASEGDDGFQIINMTTPSSPSAAGNGTDDSGGYKKLDGANDVDTFKIGTDMYAIIASRGAAMDTTNYGGFQIVDVSNPYRPLAAGSGTDNGSFSASHYTELDGASGVKTFKIGTYTYAIIASEDDDGVQMIRITDSDIISPSLHDMEPDLDLVSGTLTFDFNETIDVSSINATQIEIKDRYDKLITNLNGSKLPSTDSYKFTITLTGAQYKSILVAITNDKEPLEINVGGTAIPDFYSNHAEFTATPKVVMPKSGDLFIIPTGNGADYTDSYPTGYFELRGASGVDTFEIGTDRYAIIASKGDDGFQIINMTDPSSPSAAGSGTDNDGTNDSPYPVLDDASGVKTFEIGTDRYAIIASKGDDGFQIINMTDPSSPSAAGSGSGGYTVLDESSDVDIFTVGEGAGKKTYAIVTSPGQNRYSGFQIINMTDPSSPSAAGHGIGYDSRSEKLSETYLGLNFAHGVDTFTIENEDGTTSTYAIIASIGDPPSLLSGGFQIINMTDPYIPTAAGSGTDDSDGYTELEGASDVDTFKIGTDRYAIIASEGNSTLPGGFQIINMTDPYTPSAAGSGTDGSGGYEELDGAIGVETFTRPNDMGEEKTYAIIASEDDDGFQIINMTDPYTPSAAGHFSDNPSTLLGTPNAVDTFEIGCHTYAIIASKSDPDSDLRSGFQTVELTSDLTSPVITLLGDNPQTINLGDPYIERRATADDGSEVIPDSSEVNTNVTGTYHVTYDSIDPSCNAATQVRTVNVTSDTTAPTIISILREDPTDGQTNDTTPTFRITFSEAVKDVNGDDFTTAAGAGAAGVDSIAVEPVSDDVYDVTVTTISDGTVNLDVDANNDIADIAGNPLTMLTPTGGDQTFTVDRDLADTTAPTVISILREDPTDGQTNDTTPTFRITFGESVAGVTYDGSDFTTAAGAGAAGVDSIAVEQVSDDVYDVTVTTISDGTVNLDVDANNDIADIAGNPLTMLTPTGGDQTFTVVRDLVDTTAPTVISILREDPTDGQTNDTTPTFRITFGESVAGVTYDGSDFTTAAGAGAAGVDSIAVEPVSDDVYDVTVTTISDGTVNLDVDANNDIADIAGNPLTMLTPTGGDQTFTVVRDLVDTTAPTVISILREDPTDGQTNDTTPTFRITFGESVAGVTYDGSDFTTAAGAGAAGVDSIAVEPVSDDVYDVTVTTISDGTVNLDVDANNDIADIAGNPLTMLTPTGGDQTFTVVRDLVDTTAPTVISILREDPTDGQTNDTTPTFRITFGEDVTGVTYDGSDFTTAAGAGAAGVDSIAVEQVSDDVYDVTVTTISDGAVNLDVAEGHNISDIIGNPLINPAPTGGDQTFTVVRDLVDTTAPTVISILREDPTDDQ